MASLPHGAAPSCRRGAAGTPFVSLELVVRGRNMRASREVALSDCLREVSMKRIALASLVALALIATVVPASAHCQIPCGIFDDELRVQLIEEDITTIEKSMNQIIAIPKTAPVDYNQLVRWVNNKEEHAQKIQDIVTAYFMAQRIKPPADLGDEKAMNEYLNKLALLHAIQIHAMKAKQGIDLAEITTLRDLVAKFRIAYFGEEAAHTH
jgi:nickel superoxide dismutase